MSLVDEFLSEANVFAVVGASTNPEKYGHKLFRDLLEAGYHVFPVNPNADFVLSRKAYDSLSVLPEKPDVVDLVVPPKVSEELVKQCKELGITRVWFQPGSESNAALRFCEENGIDFISGLCIMVTRKE